MHSQMNRNRYDVVREDIDFPRPSAQRRMPVFDQFRVEERVERVRFRKTRVLSPLYDQIHVEIDYFVVQPV